jgi:hypothetical protein
MATTPQTQAYLTETAAPTVTPAAVKTALASFLGGVGNYQKELATEIMLLNAALLAETDPTVIQRLALESQVLGALRREVSKLEDQARNVAPVLDQRVQYNTDFRTNPQVIALGYTV